MQDNLSNSGYLRWLYLQNLFCRVRQHSHRLQGLEHGSFGGMDSDEIVLCVFSSISCHTLTICVGFNEFLTSLSLSFISLKICQPLSFQRLLLLWDSTYIDVVCGKSPTPPMYSISFSLIFLEVTKRVPSPNAIQLTLDFRYYVLLFQNINYFSRLKLLLQIIFSAFFFLNWFDR